MLFPRLINFAAAKRNKQKNYRYLRDAASQRPQVAEIPIIRQPTQLCENQPPNKAKQRSLLLVITMQKMPRRAVTEQKHQKDYRRDWPIVGYCH